MNFRDLKVLQERQKKKCEKLEQVCREKEFLFSSQIQNLQAQNKVGVVYVCYNFMNIKLKNYSIEIIFLNAFKLFQ